MSIELIAILVSFVGLFIMIWQMNHQINSRLDRMDDKIDKVETNLRDEIKATNTKIDTLLLGLFRASLPEQPKQNKDVA